MIERRAIGADDLLVVAHIEINMRMVVGWQRPDALEFARADLNYCDAAIVMEVRDDVVSHGLSALAGRL
jgi:hypothetical protein